MKTNLHSTSGNEMQSYAMAARALRGDTIYHRHPYIGAPSGSRIGSYTAHKPEKKAQEKSFEIFPNPNKGIFTIDLGFIPESTIQVQVFDMVGKEIFSNFQNEKSEVYSLEHFSSGVYLYVITQGSNQLSRGKLFIE